MQTLRKYLQPYKKYVWLAPFFMLIETGAELLTPTLMTILIQQGVETGNVSFIAKMGAIMIGVALFGIVGSIGCLIAAAKASQGTGADMRKAAFVKIQSFSFHNIDTFQTSSLITRLTNDITQIQMVIFMILHIMIRAPLLCLGSIFMAFQINGKMAGIFLLIISIVVVAIAGILKIALPRFRIVQERLDAVNTVMRECLAGIRVVKAFVRHSYEEEKFQKVNESYKASSLNAFFVMMMAMPAMMLVLNCSIVAILWFGAKMTVGGSLFPEDIMALITYLMQMLMSMMMIGMIFMMISRSKVSIDRVLEILQTEVDLKDPIQAKHPEIQNGKVEYKDVSFRYDNGTGEPVLSHISFTANPGETVAILGKTGAGKSTLVNLMPRLYDVTEGEVLVDGVNVKDYSLTELRQKISPVLQETILFSGTIRENIKWGRALATDEEMVAAAKAAKAHDFIMSFPEGYDTQLGQKGVNVSGGQKQRISIARSLIRQSEILIFDDSTSAVDSLTEKEIWGAMAETHKGCTKFIIAQRISSVKDADKILVLKNGTIVAEGTHEELMEKSEDYQEIYASQMRKGEM